MKHFFTLLLFGCIWPLFSQNQAPSDADYLREHYTKREAYIPMRDGKRLFTTIYTPKDVGKKYPILIRRTPYSCSPYGVDAYPDQFRNMNLAKAGYIFVFQDVRGRFMSEGDFIDIRPYIPAADPSPKGKPQIDEATDTYDTAEWLLHNAVGNNGNIGVLGISYPGFYATMTLLAGHPAIKAVSPQAPVTDWFIGDDFHHNGAFMLMDAFSFYSGFGKPRPKPTMEEPPGFSDWNTPDKYDFYLKTGAIRNFSEKRGMKDIPFWNDLLAHPNYDDWWRARNVRAQLKNISAAVLTVGGLFDAEDCWGAWNTYKALEKQNADGLSNHLVMGPWIHGGWAKTKGDRLGNIRFGAPTSEFYQNEIELKFFEHYLKNEGSMQLPEASIFETGSNRWTQYDSWPPKNIENTAYYFASGNRLVTAAPAISPGAPLRNGDADGYTSNPARPVPYTEDVHLGRTREYMCDDQRFASRRPDVLVYETEILHAPLTVTGAVVADLSVTLSTTDADFVVKIIDVLPDTLQDVENGVPMGGYQMLVRGEIFRGRYREGFDRPKAFEPGKLTQVKFELPDIAHTFLPGHRLMVQVQSSWFPLADRNPQQFINIYQAEDKDFVPCDIRVFLQGAGSSKVILPVLKR